VLRRERLGRQEAEGAWTAAILLFLPCQERECCGGGEAGGEEGQESEDGGEVGGDGLWFVGVES
jgi:hypothetical protein